MENTVVPVRLQRSRKKGSKMVSPNGLPVVYVGRGSAWGNPFIIGKDGTAKEVVQKYADSLTPYRHHGENSGMDKLLYSIANMDAIKHELRGKNLACWCAPDQPCHADVLLEIANED